MDLNLKLKDHTLIKIESELDTERVYDYYGDYDRPTQDIRFIFDDGMIVDFLSIRDDSASFTYLASFFYQKDFSEYTKDQFISEFSEYVSVKPSVRRMSVFEWRDQYRDQYNANCSVMKSDHYAVFRDIESPKESTGYANYDGREF